jgi:diguanylate cyclase (GGDEF)-like protein
MELTMEKEQKNSILIIDDELSNLKLLTHILESDYTIYIAKNGANGIEKAKELMPDLILLDIVMPEIDGYEVLVALKSCEETKQIPVVFISELASDEDEEKGLSLDAADYISKPFSPKIAKLRVRNQIQIINQMRTIDSLSKIDQLTGIPNRRSFDERINAEWNRAIRDYVPISILMIDVDKFKIYNDTYGHQQGDIVLQVVAKVFTQSLMRSTDFVARWGGEEFTVLLPGTTLSGALSIAEHIRENVENALIPFEGVSNTKVTVSIGVNSLMPRQNIPIDLFIAAADEALYTAKKTGRNKVVHTAAAE